MINPWAIVGGLCLLISVAFGGAVAGRKIERSEWQAKEIKTAAASQKALSDAIANAQRIQLAQDATSRKVISTYEQQLTELDKKYNDELERRHNAGGLRVSRTICADNTLPAPSAGTVQPDDTAAATVLLPSRVTESLYDTSKRADELAEQLRGLQEWVKAAGYYGEPP